MFFCDCNELELTWLYPRFHERFRITKTKHIKQWHYSASANNTYVFNQQLRPKVNYLTNKTKQPTDLSTVLIYCQKAPKSM
jgi:hypothetical protein